MSAGQNDIFSEMQVQSRPIGVFDSGLGGLSAVRQLREILPNERIIYFGDTGRVPYGTRGEDTIISYAKQDIAFLLSKNVKIILAACGTVSSTLPQQVTQNLGVDYMGVLFAAAQKAASLTKNGRVGIIGTQATIAAASLENMVKALCPTSQVMAVACPLFVPLVENGRFEQSDELVRLVVKEYLAPLKAAEVDTLILACTHYPLLSEAIAAYMGGFTTLVDTGCEAAIALKQTLLQKNMLSTAPHITGAIEYYVTDDPQRFDRLARIFLREDAEWNVSRIDIERYTL